MNKLLVIALVLSISIPTTSRHAVAQIAEPESGATVCVPDAYLVAPDDCLPIGPSVQLTELARYGLTDPERPFQYQKPDSSLTQIPYTYFHLEEDYVPLLNGPGGTEAGPGFLPGFVYVTYVERVDTGKGIYYRLENGSWIPGKGARVGDYSRFQGL